MKIKQIKGLFISYLDWLRITWWFCLFWNCFQGFSVNKSFLYDIKILIAFSCFLKSQLDNDIYSYPSYPIFAVIIWSDFGAQKNSLPLFPHLFAMKWWDQMPWSSFSECWGLSQLFHSLIMGYNLFPFVSSVFIWMLYKQATGKKLLVTNQVEFWCMALLWPELAQPADSMESLQNRS